MPPYPEPQLPPLTPAQREQTARYVERLSQIADQERWMPNTLIRTGLDTVASVSPEARRRLWLLCESFEGWEREWAFDEISKSVSDVFDKIIEQRVAQRG